MSKITYRELAPEEFYRLDGLGIFQGSHPPEAGTMVVAAEDEDGKIVGYWCAFDTVHLEPLWTAPAPGRKQGAIAVGLWKLLRAKLVEARIDGGFALVADEDVGTNLPMAARLGFRRLPVSTLYVDLRAALKDPEEEEG